MGRLIQIAASTLLSGGILNHGSLGGYISNATRLALGMGLAELQDGRYITSPGTMTCSNGQPYRLPRRRLTGCYVPIPDTSNTGNSRCGTNIFRHSRSPALRTRPDSTTSSSGNSRRWRRRKTISIPSSAGQWRIFWNCPYQRRGSIMTTASARFCRTAGMDW